MREEFANLGKLYSKNNNKVSSIFKTNEQKEF